MLRDAWFIARKDTQYIVREWETILWLFIMPVMFFFFIGTITSRFGGNRAAKDRIAVQVAEDAGFLANELEKRLELAGYEVVHPPSEAEFKSYLRRLTIPAGFTRSALAGEKITVSFSRSEEGLTQQYDLLRVRRAVYTVLADLVSTVATGEKPDPESFRKIQQMPRTLTIEVQSGGKRQEVPTGFEQAIPGTMVMFTLTVLLTSGAVTVVSDRRIGVLRRLAATPISRGSIVLGKWIGRLMLSFVQIAFAMTVGTLLFKMKWGADLPMVLLVLLGWGGLCASLALLLGNIARTEGQAIGVGVLASNVLAALGGCWWPIEITPEWMQSLAKILPTGWTMDALHKLVNFRAGAASAVPHTIALFTASFVIGWLAARRFRFE